VFEGVFYIWDSTELKQLLTIDEFSFISNVLNIKESGNCVVEGQRVNIPHLTNDWSKLILDSDMDTNEFENKYHLIRNKIFNHRENRVHPQKDDKILTDWNGLMISALARASIILDKEDYLIAAKKSSDFIIENLIDDKGALLKRHRNGISGIDGMIEDYAFFIWGLIELYQADFNVKYIELAAKLSD
jgi:hypothetical protein